MKRMKVKQNETLPESAKAAMEDIQAITGKRQYIALCSAVVHAGLWVAQEIQRAATKLAANKTASNPTSTGLTAGEARRAAGVLDCYRNAIELARKEYLEESKTGTKLPQLPPVNLEPTTDDLKPIAKKLCDYADQLESEQ